MPFHASLRLLGTRGGLAAAVGLKENVGHLFSATPFTPARRRRWREVITSSSASLSPSHPSTFSILPPPSVRHFGGSPCSTCGPRVPHAGSVGAHLQLTDSFLARQRLVCLSGTACCGKTGKKNHVCSLLASLQTNSINSSLCCISVMWFIHGTVPSAKQIKLLVFWLGFQ